MKWMTPQSYRLMPLSLCVFAVWPMARLSGQSLRPLPAAAAPGDWLSVEIALQSSGDREPAALEWETNIPSRQLEMESERMTRATLVAKDAGKSLACSLARRNAEIQLLRCVLAGGQKPIPSGTIALLTFRIPEGTRPGTARIRLQRILGVTHDLKEIPMDPAEAEITIRAR